jgi:hypothetical protein
LAIFGNVANGVGHRAAAKTCHQTGDGGAVSQPGAMVDAVGA